MLKIFYIPSYIFRLFRRKIYYIKGFLNSIFYVYKNRNKSIFYFGKPKKITITNKKSLLYVGDYKGLWDCKYINGIRVMLINSNKYEIIGLKNGNNIFGCYVSGHGKLFRFICQLIRIKKENDENKRINK